MPPFQQYPDNHALDRKLDQVLHKLDAVIHKENQIMAAIDDLKAAIGDLTAAVGDGVNEIETLLGKITAPGTSDADVEAAAAQIKSITGTLRTEIDKAKGATG